jgi:hypothetical protein
VYFTQEYPADARTPGMSQPRVEQRGGADRIVELKGGATPARGSGGAEGADVQEFRNAVSGD